MANYDQKIGIKLWAEEDRPREKLLLNGRRFLTDAELIAILIGSGNKNETAVDLSKRILSYYENNLTKLGRASITDLSKFKGIGEAKAISIVAALELGLRRKENVEEELVQVTASTDVYKYLQHTFAHLNHEEFWILLLNSANKIMGKHLISKGGQAATVVDPKIIFKVAIENSAAYIILAHNHPSGNLKPSESDNKLTRNLIAAGNMLELKIVDHLIFTDREFFSYKDEGLM
ncbi:RadC family protein [Pedobacter jejuensis]|uniref:DNA repair protein RadC n=1 Tax=Pedobacter jejuensis TaxID=1268550 RepID=A0A3N0BWZ8_9SPHI|nr:DNA repair protein RadC [Pedobacter jejuensis]RNL54158.1 DNA repair protein RadC [Pedobacter jejuensis]